MSDEGYLSILKEIAKFCPGFVLEPTNDIHFLLDQLLKSLVEEDSSVPQKSSLLQFLEWKSQVLCEEISDIELVLATFKNVFNSSSCVQALQGQCLISATTILLESSEKFSGAEFDRLISQHINVLLELMNQNNPENVYVRSVSADSLIEVELCYPLLLKPCLENIYGVTVKEMSAAHQQYTSLLSLVMKHISASSQLGIPLWNTYPQVVFKSKFLSKNDRSFTTSIHNSNQLVSFLVDELPFCNPEGMIWITSHIVEVLLHNTELRASCQVLKPLFFTCIYTFNCAIFHLLLYLEKVFGRELFEEEEHNLLLKQLLLNCSHPTIASSIRLIYFELLSDYLTHTCHQFKSIQDVHVVVPHQFDDSDIQLKKFLLLSNILKHKNGSSKFMLKFANNMRKRVRYNKGFKYKSIFIKALFKFLCDYEDVPNEDISRLIVLATTQNVTITPFVLHFIRQVQHSFPGSQLPDSVLSSLVQVYTQSTEHESVELLTFVVDIFQEVIYNKCSIECLKSILVYLYKNVLCNVICKSLNWTYGHKVLKLCSSIMKEYNTSRIFYEINNVLQGIIFKYENDDVKDRAQFYLSLLNTLSDKKLKTVLHGPRQALPRALTDDNTFDSQSCFQKLDKSIIYLKKVKYSFSFNQTFQFMEEDDDDIITAYKDFISSNPSCKTLTVRISLKMSQEYENLDCAEALAIFIETPYEWGNVDPITIGHFKEEPVFLHQRNDCSYNMVCHPHYPQPTQANVRAEFSLDNICHTCSLEPFAIEFQDFFCVLPVCDEINMEHFFEALWKALEDNFHSVMVLEYSEAKSKETVKQKLDRFIISEDCKGYHVGIYLPPGNHLLMKFNFQPSRTIVKFVTDYIYILSLTNAMFKDFL